MKVLFIAACFIIAVPHDGKAQEEKSEKSMMSFHTLGFSVFLDYYASPVEKIKLDYLTTTYNSVTGLYDTTSYTYAQTVLFGLGSVQYKYRRNIKEFSSNTALAFSINPSFGVHFTGDQRKEGALSIVVPVMIELETGAGSTYNSEKNSGAFIGLGGEYIRGPLIKSKEFVGRSGWFEPVVCGGIRYWSRGNTLREINVKLGMAGKGDAIPSDYYQSPTSWKSVKPFSFRASWVMFFNY